MREPLIADSCVDKVQKFKFCQSREMHQPRVSDFGLDERQMREFSQLLQGGQAGVGHLRMAEIEAIELG